MCIGLVEIEKEKKWPKYKLGPMVLTLGFISNLFSFLFTDLQWSGLLLFDEKFLKKMNQKKKFRNEEGVEPGAEW